MSPRRRQRRLIRGSQRGCFPFAAELQPGMVRLRVRTAECCVRRRHGSAEGPGLVEDDRVGRRVRRANASLNVFGLAYGVDTFDVIVLRVQRRVLNRLALSRVFGSGGAGLKHGLVVLSGGGVRLWHELLLYLLCIYVEFAGPTLRGAAARGSRAGPCIRVGVPARSLSAGSDVVFKPSLVLA
jgi:hypothetical protein